MRKKCKKIICVLMVITFCLANVTPIPKAAVKAPAKAKIISVTQNQKGNMVIKINNQKNVSDYIIYRSTKPNSGYVQIDSCWSNDNSPVVYEDSNNKIPQLYYYKVRAAVYNTKTWKQKKGPYSDAKSAEYKYTLQTEPADRSTIKISFPYIEGMEKYEIKRKNEDGTFTTIKTINSSYSSWGSETYKDKNLLLGQTYYYMVTASHYETVEEPVTTAADATTATPDTTEQQSYAPDGTQTETTTESAAQEYDTDYSSYDYSESQPETTTREVLINSYDSKVCSAMTGPEKVKISNIKVTGPGKMKITWKTIPNVSGYKVLEQKEDGTYKVFKKISSSKTSSCNISKVAHGQQIKFVVISYITYKGHNIDGVYGTVKTGLMNYYSCDLETTMDRSQRIFHKKYLQSYSSANQASKHMKTIQIRVWDYKRGSSGPKVTKTVYLTVHKNIAPSVKKIFEEIYKGKEKFPIHSIGGYSYRTGQHAVGLAIDINPNENYMIDGGKILCGTLYKPGKNPYSIPTDGEVATIMRKYGFYQGLWGSRCDYMHFSYYGV